MLDSSDLANLGVFTLGCMQGFEAIVPGFSSLTKVILSLGIQVATRTLDFVIQRSIQSYLLGIWLGTSLLCCAACS